MFNSCFAKCQLQLYVWSVFSWSMKTATVMYYCWIFPVCNFLLSVIRLHMELFSYLFTRLGLGCIYRSWSSLRVSVFLFMKWQTLKIKTISLLIKNKQIPVLVPVDVCRLLWWPKCKNLHRWWWTWGSWHILQTSHYSLCPKTPHCTPAYQGVCMHTPLCYCSNPTTKTE